MKCRYESVHFNRIDGLAKVLGVLASVGGASIITLYKGPVIYTPRLALHQEQYLSVLGDATGKNWNLGGIYLFGHSLCWSGWIVMQALWKKYLAPLTVSAFTCFFGVVQFLTNAAFFEKDYKAWQFNSSREICSVLFSVGKLNWLLNLLFFFGMLVWCFYFHDIWVFFLLVCIRDWWLQGWHQQYRYGLLAKEGQFLLQFIYLYKHYLYLWWHLLFSVKNSSWEGRFL